MNISEDDRTFLRDLVKTSRQKPHHVSWVDRDGTARVTIFSAPEITRFNALAQKLGVGKPELMRQAAHIPAASSVTVGGVPSPRSDVAAPKRPE